MYVLSTRPTVILRASRTAFSETEIDIVISRSWDFDPRDSTWWRPRTDTHAGSSMSGRDARWDRVSRSARCSPWHLFWPTTKINGGSPSTASSNTRTPIWRPAPCKTRCLNLSLRHAETRLEIDAASRVFSVVTHLAFETLRLDFTPRDHVRKFDSGRCATRSSSNRDFHSSSGEQLAIRWQKFQSYYERWAALMNL